MILAIMDDVIFRAKLEAAATQLGVSVTIASDAAEALRTNLPWSRALIDLNGSHGDSLAMVRALRQAHPDRPVIGYCSHIQQDLQQQALEMGCTRVLARSAFVQQLPELLKCTDAPTKR